MPITVAARSKALFAHPNTEIMVSLPDGCMDVFVRVF
jgi:hypothetical protein